MYDVQGWFWKCVDGLIEQYRDLAQILVALYIEGMLVKIP